MKFRALYAREGLSPKIIKVFRKIVYDYYRANARDLRALSCETLIEQFGKWGSELYEKARGLDDSPVEESDEIKSVGEQETFEEDTLDLPRIIERLNVLCSGVHKSFLRAGFAGFRTIVLTATFADF